jgi:hypothetical protein
MATESPRRLSAAELLARQNRVALIAETLGFVGNVEYRHVDRQGTGGMQYGRGSTQDNDLLIVYAEAFERDADPEDFSLEAMLAHERGHQILARHPRIAKRLAGISRVGEEILASLLGMMICQAEEDREMLYAKAAGELLAHGHSGENVKRQLRNLWDVLEALL